MSKNTEVNEPNKGYSLEKSETNQNHVERTIKEVEDSSDNCEISLQVKGQIDGNLFADKQENVELVAVNVNIQDCKANVEHGNLDDRKIKNQENDKSVKDTVVSETDSGLEYDTRNIHYEGDVAIYADTNSGYQYQWDKNKNEWVLRNHSSCTFEDDNHIYTDSDGTKFFWDKEKRAWFPKVDEDFMAVYQMSYGFNDDKTGFKKPEVKPVEPNVEEIAKNKNKNAGEKRKASDPTWFELDDRQNTNVYVSNLPLDIEEQEFIDLMQKCGLVMRDPVSGNFKIKLYKEPGTKHLKGDALCTYIKIESVELALNLIDGYEYKGHKIKVERAKFQLKGDYNPKLKPKMRKKKEKLKLKKQQEKLFDWRPEKKLGDRAKHERVVIIKNLFDPSIFDKDVGLILEFQQDLREEAGKIGEVRKVIIYDRHPEGTAQITMASAEEADQVVLMLNGRWFMKRQLSAEIWDGKTKFKIAETDSQINQRLENWDKFLEDEDKEHSFKNTVGNVEDLNAVSEVNK